MVTKKKEKKSEKTPQKLGTGQIKYSDAVAKILATALTHKTIPEACKEVGIHHSTFYDWLRRYPDFAELSIEARKVKAVGHFSKCEEILHEIDLEDGMRDSEGRIRPEIARLRLDFHLRLAGKANQGLFGDKVEVDNKTKEPIQVNIN